MSLHHTLLVRLARDAGYDIDFDQKAIATACDTQEVTAFLEAAFALACAKLRVAWASDAVDSTHDMIRSVELGELDKEGTYLGNAVAARQVAHDLLRQRTTDFHRACGRLHSHSDLLIRPLDHPAYGDVR